jgi:hypothetical protein
MYLGLDRDTGRDDRATPATRGDAERVLREYTTGTSDVSCGATEGLCPECAIELALKEADSRGLTPESPEFGEIFERIFAEGNPAGDVKVRFLGAQKVGEPMPAELKSKLDAIVDPFPGTLISQAELEELVRTLPSLPSILDAYKPSFGSTALVPLAPVFGSPSNPTIGGDDMELPGLDELLKRIFETPKGERLSKPTFDDLNERIEQRAAEFADADDFEDERRGVVQDLVSAVLNLTEQLHDPAAEDTAAALRDIAALARETYEI